MKFPQALRRNTIATLCCTAFATMGLPGVAFGADAEVMAKIEAMQREIEALKAQIKAQPASSGGASAPAGFELAVYGVGHLSADRIDVGPSSSSYVHSNSSRLGFKGSQSLPGGSAAIFQYESGADLTGNGTGDGNGGAASGGQVFTRTRDSFVGVQGSFGSVVFGRQGGLNQWLYDYNLFGDQIGDLGNIWGGDGLPGRLNKVVKYTTPDLSGFTVGLTYAPNQGTPDTDSVVAKADFGKGGIKVGAAYAKFGQGATFEDTKVGAITASYSTSAFNVGGGWQRETDIAGVSGADRSKYTLGAGVNVGASGMIKAQFARANKMSGVADSAGRQWAIGYDYGWNKDTTVYVAYSRTNNGSAANYTAHDYGHGDNGVPGIIAGEDPAALSFGIVYKFDAGIIGKR